MADLEQTPDYQMRDYEIPNGTVAGIAKESEYLRNLPFGLHIDDALQHNNEFMKTEHKSRRIQVSARCFPLKIEKHGICVTPSAYELVVAALQAHQRGDVHDLLCRGAAFKTTDDIDDNRLVYVYFHDYNKSVVLAPHESNTATIVKKERRHGSAKGAFDAYRYQVCIADMSVPDAIPQEYRGNSVYPEQQS